MNKSYGSIFVLAIFIFSASFGNLAQARSLPVLGSSNSTPDLVNSETVISFALPEREEAALVLYNLAGQQVATLAHGMREAGMHTLTWDGTDGHGNPLASGVYLYHLQTSTREQTRKLLLLR